MHLHSSKLKEANLDGSHEKLTLFESTPSNSAFVLSLAFMVVFRTPSTYTWYESMQWDGESSGAFHRISILLLSCLSNVSCFGAGTSTEKNISKNTRSSKEDQLTKLLK